MRIPAAPAPAPASVPVSDMPTARMTAAPAPAAPQASDIPTHRLTAPSAIGVERPAADAGKSRPSAAPELPAPLRPAPPVAPKRARGGALAWPLAHWRLLALVMVILALGIASLSVYNYAQSLAAQPQKIVSRYCAALTHADYKTAYTLLASSLQAQSTLPQYEADSAARDAIGGRVTRCSATPAQQLSALSFLRNPRSLIFNLTLTRASGESGQLALARDTAGWHVAGLSAGVAGIDLGPLHTEQSLCQAFIARKYDVAYGLLSTPYQREQGSETAFARAFGANLAITGCAPTLSGYTVDHADQRSSFQALLNVAVSGGGASTKLALPVKMTLVREPDGWRVDSITPLLGQ